MSVMTLDQDVERVILEAIQQTEQGSFLALDPETAQKIINNLAQKLEKFSELNIQPIVVCSAQIRYQFKKMIDRFVPSLIVLSYDEILNTVKIQSLGTVELTNAD